MVRLTRHIPAPHPRFARVTARSKSAIQPMSSPLAANPIRRSKTAISSWAPASLRLRLIDLNPDYTGHMRIVGISGSLRSASTNTNLLAAAANLAPDGVEFHVTKLIAELPAFNPDANSEQLPSVKAWIQEVRASDGIIVSTPEYARGYPGSLKNALDWLVGTDAYVDKPFMLLNASARSKVAQETLTTVLETMSGKHIVDASATVPLLGTTLSAAAIQENQEFAAQISRSLAIFVEAIRVHIARQ